MAAQELYTTSFFNSSQLAWYARFEETSGTIVTDWSTHANNGTASRAAILNNAGGQFGNMAVYTAGSSDFVNFGTTSFLEPTGNFTVYFWLKTTTPAAEQQLLMSYQNASSKAAGFFTAIESTGKIRILSGKNTGLTNGVDFAFLDSTGTISDNTWHFVVCTWDGSFLRAYIDGTASGSLSWANAPAYQATSNFNLGRINTTADGQTNYYNGDMDDSALFNGTAFAASDINAIWNGTAPTRGGAGKMSFMSMMGMGN